MQSKRVLGERLANQVMFIRPSRQPSAVALEHVSLESSLDLLAGEVSSRRCVCLKEILDDEFVKSDRRISVGYLQESRVLLDCSENLINQLVGDQTEEVTVQTAAEDH